MSENKTSLVHIRMSNELKKELNKNAKALGRSLTSEINIRLNESLNNKYNEKFLINTVELISFSSGVDIESLIELLYEKINIDL